MPPLSPAWNNFSDFSKQTKYDEKKRPFRSENQFLQESVPPLKGTCALSWCSAKDSCSQPLFTISICSSTWVHWSSGKSIRGENSLVEELSQNDCRIYLSTAAAVKHHWPSPSPVEVTNPSSSSSCMLSIVLSSPRSWNLFFPPDKARQ